METKYIGWNITAVLMASGFSKRFGSPNKLLIPFQGKPLARHTLELVWGLGCFHRICFITADDSVSALAQDLPITLIKNERPELGQRESIRLGVLAAPGDYYLFFPCDQPLLDQDTVLRILEARKPGYMVQPAFQGVPGNPGLFSHAFREELLHLLPGEQGRAIKARHPQALITVALPRQEPLLDIDSPAALAAIGG